MFSHNIVIPFLLILWENWKKRRPLFSEAKKKNEKKKNCAKRSFLRLYLLCPSPSLSAPINEFIF